jgi:hypothetical protein
MAAIIRREPYAVKAFAEWARVTHPISDGNAWRIHVFIHITAS